VRVQHQKNNYPRPCLRKSAFTSDIYVARIQVVSTRIHLYRLSPSTRILYRRGDMNPLISGYKLLVRDTCIRLHVSGVNAAWGTILMTPLTVFSNKKLSSRGSVVNMMESQPGDLGFDSPGDLHVLYMDRCWRLLSMAFRSTGQCSVTATIQTRLPVQNISLYNKLKYTKYLTDNLL